MAARSEGLRDAVISPMPNGPSYVLMDGLPVLQLVTRECETLLNILVGLAGGSAFLHRSDRRLADQVWLW